MEIKTRKYSKPEWIISGNYATYKMNPFLQPLEKKRK